MLDASLLQYLLFEHGHETSEITFGANLMSSQLVIDIGKANKMFRIERGDNMKDFYRSSMHCSEYIRHTITESGSRCGSPSATGGPRTATTSRIRVLSRCSA